MTARSLIFLPLVVAMSGCSSSSSTTGGDTSTATAASSGSAAPKGSAASASASAIDAKMLALAAPVLACTYDEKQHSFGKCPALDTFGSSNDEYFKTKEADAALVDMLTGSDEKLAVIATKRWLDDRQLDDPARAAKLMDTAEANKGPSDVESAVVRWLAHVDLEKAGLADRVKAIAKNPSADVKRAFGYGILQSSSDKHSPAAFDLESGLVTDADKEVVKSASMGLGNASRDGNKACDILSGAVDKADDKTQSIVWSAGSAHCKGLGAKVIDYVSKQVSDPTKIQNAFGISIAQAVQFACRQDVGDDEKKKGYQAGLNMTDAKDPDPNTRSAAMSTLVSCDPKRAADDIDKLTKDKEKFVADSAKRELDSLKKAEKHEEKKDEKKHDKKKK